MSEIASIPRRQGLWEVSGVLTPVGPERSFQILAWAVVAVVAASCVLLHLPQYQWFSDYWEHAAAIRALADNPWSPSNPHYASADPDRWFIPPFLLGALGVRHLGMSIAGVQGLIGIVTAIVFVFALGRFARMYFADRWAPFATLSVFLVAWGTPWVWTGCYEFRALFYNIYYPSMFVFALTFVAWALVIGQMREARSHIGAWLALVATTALMMTSHQLGAAFAIGGVVLLLLFEPHCPLRVRFACAAAVAAGVGLSAAWPYYNPLALMFGGTGQQIHDGHPQFYQFIPVLLLLGPALLGLYALIRMLARRRQITLAVGFSAVFLAYLLGGLIEHPITHRLLPFSIVFLHLALVWEILERVRGRAGSPHGNQWLLFAAFGWAVVQIGFGALDFVRFGVETVAGRTIGSFPHQPVTRVITAVARDLPDDAVVFASHSPGLVLPAVGQKVVSRPRSELMIADGPARKADQARFFGPDTADQDRRALAAKYGAAYVVWRDGDVPDAVGDSLAALGAVVARHNDVTIVRLPE
jgi:hypothetical protein